MKKLREVLANSIYSVSLSLKNLETLQERADELEIEDDEYDQLTNVENDKEFKERLDQLCSKYNIK